MKFISDLLAESTKAEPRDDEGLTAKQRKFLAARQNTLSDKAALDLIGSNMAQLLKWKAEDAFQQAYETLVPHTSYEDVQRGLDALLPEALRLLEKAIDGEELTKTQRWVVEKLFRARGLEKLTVESQTTSIPFEAHLALAMAERGRALPPALRDLLARYFPQVALPPASIVEGEVIDAEG